MRGNTQLSNVVIENNQIYNTLLGPDTSWSSTAASATAAGPTGWSFNPDVLWNSPFWSGKEADLPESSLNGAHFNTDGTTRVFIP